MTTPADVLTIARSLIGTKEIPDGSNQAPPVTTWYPMVGAWCGMAASYCAVHAGLPIKFAWTPSGRAGFQNGTYGTWHTDPEPGDFVFYSFGGQRTDHVELVEAVHANGTMTTLGGNVGNAFKRLVRNIRGGGVQGFGRPRYDGVPATTPAPATPTTPAPGPQAPAFPLPRGSYFGPRSGPAASVSGYFSHRADLKRWQQQMAKRGWRIEVDGLYGDGTAAVVRKFQTEKRLTVDGKIGPATWAAAWTSPVT